MSSFWRRVSPESLPLSGGGGKGGGPQRHTRPLLSRAGTNRQAGTPTLPSPSGEGEAFRRIGFVVALSLLPLAVWAGPYADLDARLAGKPDAAAVAGLREIAGDDADALAALKRGPQAARSYVSLRATLEGAPPTKPPAIGALPGGERKESHWLSDALARLRMPEIDLPRPRGGGMSGGIGAWATTLMWILLGALGAFAAYMLARHIRLPKGKRKIIADDEEPLRSADAWLEEANALIAQGRYREAVRGLYVAGLMRFDEAGVARFDRHQTNWEHLRRIEASPRRPEGADVRTATGRFDRLWYGHLPSTLEDATAMRSWYDGIVQRLAEARAA